MGLRVKCLINGVIGLSLLSISVGAVSDEFSKGFLAAEKGDYAVAVSAWTPLAKQGHPDAQFNLALLYHSGSTGQVDEKLAVILYHKAAENGHRAAQEYLAAGYMEGWFGLDKDVEKAQHWFAKANQ